MQYDNLRKELLGALIALAKTSNSNLKTENTDRILIEGLVAAKTEVFGEEMLQKKLDMVRQEKHVISPNCSTCASPCGNTSEYDLDLLKEEEETCQKIKYQMLSELQEAAKKVYQAMMLKMDVSEQMDIFYKVLEIVTYTFEPEDLLKIQEELKETMK
ncbi:MAG: hypothetical protein IJ455_08100 [Agathobacter sp.]|nr:hypothetical protein [Agathobacter sp.]